VLSVTVPVTLPRNVCANEADANKTTSSITQRQLRAILFLSHTKVL